MIDFSKRVTLDQMAAETANSTMLAKWREKWGNKDLSTSPLSDLAGWMTDAATRTSAGDNDIYAPFKGVMVRVVVSANDALPLRWDYAGDTYARTAEGLRMATHSGWREVK